MRPGLIAGLAIGALGAVAMGSAAPGLKLLAATELTPVNVIQVRTVVGALALLAAALLLRRGRLAIPRRDWWLVAVYGVVTIAVNQVVYTVALGRLPVGVALLLEYLAPVLVALWVRFVRRESVPGLLWVGVAALLVGLALVSRIGESGAPGGPGVPGGAGAVGGVGVLDGMGVLFGLLAAVTLAGRFLLAERGLRTHDPLVMATWGSCLGAVALVAAAPFAPFPVAVLGESVGGVPAWALGLYVGLVGMAGAIVLGAFAQRLIPSTSASVVAALEIVVGSTLAAVVLGERLTPGQWGGMASMVAGIVLAQIALARRGLARDTVHPRDPDVPSPQEPRGEFGGGEGPPQRPPIDVGITEH